MKKVVAIIIFVASLAACVGFFVLESLSYNLNLLSKSLISFSLNKSQIYISQTKDNILTISTGQVAFENPQIFASDNVDFEIKDKNDKEIKLAFCVCSGVQIYFEISSKNYETARQTYVVKQIENVLTYAFEDENRNTLNLTKTSGKYVLHFVENASERNNAKMDGFISQVYLTLAINNKSVGLTSFNIEISPNLEFSGSKLTVIAEGEASIKLNHKENLHITTEIKFLVKQIDIESITGLPSYVMLDVKEAPIFNLNFICTPSYATSMKMDFDKSIINITNKKITALKAGSVVVQITLVNKTIYNFNVIVVDGYLQGSTLDKDSVYDYSVTLKNASTNLKISSFDNITIVDVSSWVMEVNLNACIYKNKDEIQSFRSDVTVLNGSNFISEAPVFITPLILNINLLCEESRVQGAAVNGSFISQIAETAANKANDKSSTIFSNHVASDGASFADNQLVLCLQQKQLNISHIILINFPK